MNTNFKVSVNNSYNFEVKKEDIDALDVVTSKAKYHLLKNNTSFKAEIIAADFNTKSYTVKINQNIYTIAISDALDQLIDTMGFAATTAKQVRKIMAPMPGLILDIPVTVGQEVREDDTLVILEAMKMENSILSPREGIIKSINITKGDAVDKNHLLIEFE
jgi:biotin carboxyl carrier protein